eukprot:6780848-Pyramimonas_sp.AAC.1
MPTGPRAPSQLERAAWATPGPRRTGRGPHHPSNTCGSEANESRSAAITLRAIGEASWMRRSSTCRCSVRAYD